MVLKGGPNEPSLPKVLESHVYASLMIYCRLKGYLYQLPILISICSGFLAENLTSRKYKEQSKLAQV